ncbi:MAG: adenine phosphoribosyltransferase [Flavobacteriales bacterium]|jgi:adenine phosphoribosyltransferase|nr:adenine phosphoribosyltransferase [Flavobacteriales bacterium]|tara:strand:- start:1145 stop:1675 length:531 start_codon:yes stop_codon:yes gene_type:complete
MNDDDLKSMIRTIPDFPKKGIMFRDITTILQNKDGFAYVIDKFYERYKDKDIDIVVGIESRGFIFGATLAYKLGCSFVPVRKEGKLPHKTINQEYALEYGKAVVEIHKDAIKQGDKVLIVDDLIATAGTLDATIKLVELLDGKVIECAIVVELIDLKGREKLKEYNVFSLVEFEGE